MEKIEFKNHSLFIVKRIIGFLVAAVFLLAQEVIKDTSIFKESGMSEVLIVVISVILVLITVKAYIKWKNTSYIILDGYLIYVYKGVFKKEEKKVRLSQISNINLEQSVLDKILNIGKVKMDISSSHTAAATDFEILVAKKDMPTIKAWIEEQGKENYVEAMTKENIEDQKTAVKYKDFTKYIKDRKRLNFKEIFYSSHIQQEQKKGVFTKEEYERDFSTWESIRHVILDISLVQIIFLALALVLLFSELKAEGTFVGVFLIASTVFGIVKNINSKMNFHCKRKDTKVEVTYGMLSTDTFNIAVDKITGIETTQSFFSRLLGYTNIKITAVGFGNDTSENKMIGLYMKDEKIEEFLGNVLPEYKIEEGYIKQSSKAILLYLVPAIVVGFVVGYIGSKFFPSLSLYIYLGAMIILGIIAVLKYLHEGILLTESGIHLQKGVFSRRRTTIKYDEMDQLCVQQGLLAQILGVKRIAISYKGNTGFETIMSGYYIETVFGSNFL